MCIALRKGREWRVVELVPRIVMIDRRSLWVQGSHHQPLTPPFNSLMTTWGEEGDGAVHYQGTCWLKRTQHEKWSDIKVRSQRRQRSKDLCASQSKSMMCIALRKGREWLFLSILIYSYLFLSILIYSYLFLPILIYSYLFLTNLI